MALQRRLSSVVLLGCILVAGAALGQQVPTAVSLKPNHASLMPCSGMVAGTVPGLAGSQAYGLHIDPYGFATTTERCEVDSQA